MRIAAGLTESAYLRPSKDGVLFVNPPDRTAYEADRHAVAFAVFMSYVNHCRDPIKAASALLADVVRMAEEYEQALRSR